MIPRHIAAAVVACLLSLVASFVATLFLIRWRTRES